MSKEVTISRIIENFPQELRDLHQWVVWRSEVRGNKPTKVPYNANTGGGAMSDNPSTWAAFDTAYNAFLSGNYDGIGFVFSEYDPYCGIDFDDCVDGDGGIDNEKRDWVVQLASYSEYSVSGTGAHVVIRGKLPEGGRKSNKHNVEMYDQKRFFVVTGDHVVGTPMRINDRQSEIEHLHAEIFPANPNAQVERQPVSTVGIPSDDQALLEKMFAARNGAEIRSLWNGDISNYNNDESAADLALCNHFSFYTGNDADRIDRLFRQSGLFRDKWDRNARTGETYGAGTIARAIAATNKVYDPAYRNGTNGTTNGHHKQNTIVGGIASYGQSKVVLNCEQLLRGLRTQAEQFSDERFVVNCLHDKEEGDARLLQRILTDSLVYDHSEKLWYWYNNLYWVPDRTWNIYQITSDVLSDVYRKLAMKKLSEGMELNKQIYAATEASEELREKLKKAKEIQELAQKRAAKLNEIKEVKQVLAFACSGLRLGLSGDEWDQLSYMLPAQNGIIDLRTGKLTEPHPQQYIRTFAPVDFTGIDTPATRFEQFLREVFAKQPELPNYIWRLFGYAMLGKPSEHVFPIFWGAEGRNGKDTLLNAIQNVLGTALADSVSNDVVLETKGFRSAGGATAHLMGLRGKRLAWASEPSEGARVTVGLVKLVTGGGRITARDLYKSETQFWPTHTLLLLTNHAPHIAANDSAIWERVKLIEFAERFVDNPDPAKPNEHPKDPTLGQKLEEEKSGILAWLIRGCLAYQKDGLQEPDCVRSSTTKYREKEDTLQLFFDECCIVSEGTSAKAGALYSEYKSWCLQMNLQAMTGTSFGDKVSKRFEKKRTGAGNFYFGIGLLGRNLTDD